MSQTVAVGLVEAVHRNDTGNWYFRQLFIIEPFESASFLSNFASLDIIHPARNEADSNGTNGTLEWYAIQDEEAAHYLRRLDG